MFVKSGLISRVVPHAAVVCILLATSPCDARRPDNRANGQQIPHDAGGARGHRGRGAPRRRGRRHPGAGARSPRRPASRRRTRTTT